MLIVTEKLYKTYGSKSDHSRTVALNYVDLSVEEGEFVAIMGPSGSGKTTLLNLLNGFDQPTSGGVFVQGQDLFGLSDQDLAFYRRKNLGFVFQNYHLLDSLTISENIMLPMVLDRKPVEAMKAKANTLMNLFNIGDIANQYPHQSSGGQQQRAAICRALINEPKVMFADEPTGNLDSKSARIVMKALLTANADLHTTILMVTHDPYAASYANRIVFLKDGKIVAEKLRGGSRGDFLKQIGEYLTVLEGENHDL